MIRKTVMEDTYGRTDACMKEVLQMTWSKNVLI
jgi:hypothetical protein